MSVHRNIIPNYSQQDAALYLVGCNLELYCDARTYECQINLHTLYRVNNSAICKYRLEFVSNGYVGFIQTKHIAIDLMRGDIQILTDALIKTQVYRNVTPCQPALPNASAEISVVTFRV